MSDLATVQLPKKKFKSETFVIVGLFLFGGILCLAALGHHHQNISGNNTPPTVAQNQKMLDARSPASVEQAPIKHVAGQFTVHLKSQPLNKLSHDGKFPVTATLVVDGKPVYTADHPKTMDRFLNLTKGPHNITIRMWNAQKKLSVYNYKVNMGAIPSKKLAKN